MHKKNQFGGNSSRKAAKNKIFTNKHTETPRPDNVITFLCQCVKLNGTHIDVVNSTNKPIKASIPGSLRVRIFPHDFLLVQIDDFKKYHILYKYTTEELNNLEERNGFLTQTDKDDIFERESTVKKTNNNNNKEIKDNKQNNDNETFNEDDENLIFEFETI